MSRTAEIRLAFGEGEDKLFRLSIKAWEAVQGVADMGPSELLASMHPFVMATNAKVTIGDILLHKLTGTWKPAHIRAVLLHGLVGGGMSPTEAEKLCRENVDGRPFAETVPMAYRVVFEATFGDAGERAVGEPKAGGKGRASRAASSATAKTASMPLAPPRASRPRKSAK